MAAEASRRASAAEVAAVFLRLGLTAFGAQAPWALGHKAVNGPLTGVVGAAVLGLYFLGLNELASSCHRLSSWP